MTVSIIYAGGTFGSGGRPLQPIEAEIFLPEMLKYVHLAGYSVEILPNDIVKDSSELMATDLIDFYLLIFRAYQQGQKRFVLISGTDTLGYLGAFLAEAFVGSDICIALTASMNPLFQPNQQDEWLLDKNSDAWTNLQTALNTAQQDIVGVRTCLLGESWYSQSVKKIDSESIDAFVGNYQMVYPTTHYQTLLKMSDKQVWLEKREANHTNMIKKVAKSIITSIFLLPHSCTQLYQQLANVLDVANQTDKKAYIILMSFGAGNLPYSDDLAYLFKRAKSEGHSIISTTQCVFGGVNEDYQAGSWQYQYEVLSSNKLTIEAIYARVLWLHSTVDDSKFTDTWNALLEYSINSDKKGE